MQFVLLGGEVVVDYAIRLKTEHRGENTWIAGYANDVMAYIPSRRVLLEGGYEGGGAMVYYGLPTVWAPQVEDDIVKEVLYTTDMDAMKKAIPTRKAFFKNGVYPAATWVEISRLFMAEAVLEVDVTVKLDP